MTRVEEFDRPSPAALRHRLPDSRQRDRGGGRRAGDLAQVRGVRDRARVGEVVPLGRGHAHLDRRAAVGARPAGGVRRAVVPRAARDGPVRGSGARGRAGRLGVDGRAAAARATEPARTRGLRAAGGVRVRLLRDRRRPWTDRRRRAVSSRCGPAGTWRRDGRGSRPTAGSGRSSRRGSSTRSARATSTGSRSCSRPTSRPSRTAGARARHWPSRSSAPTTSRGWSARSPRCSAASGWSEPHEINGQPGAIFHDRDGKVLAIMVLDVLDGRIQTIRTIVNPDKLEHLGPVADAWRLREEVQARRRPTA